MWDELGLCVQLLLGAGGREEPKVEWALGCCGVGEEGVGQPATPKKLPTPDVDGLKTFLL